MKRKTFTLNESAWAENPGRIEVSILRWMLRYPWRYLYLLILFAVFVALSFWHWAFFFGVAYMIRKIFYELKGVQEHFNYGHASPRIIISVNPVHIAVRTDLSKGVGYYPVILVFEDADSKRWKGGARVGMEVATVSLYYEHQDPNSPCWSYFFPLPIEPFVKRVKDIEELKATFSDKERHELRVGIDLLQSRKPGLYRMKGQVFVPDSQIE